MDFEKREDIEWLYQEANINTATLKKGSNEDGAIINVYELPMSMRKGVNEDFNQMVKKWFYPLLNNHSAYSPNLGIRQPRRRHNFFHHGKLQ